jgi:hypothetical protein
MKRAYYAALAAALPPPHSASSGERWARLAWRTRSRSKRSARACPRPRLPSAAGAALACMPPARALPASLPVLPCLALPRLALPCLALPRLASPCLALPCLALPCLASPRLSRFTLDRVCSRNLEPLNQKDGLKRRFPVPNACCGACARACACACACIGACACARTRARFFALALLRALVPLPLTMPVCTCAGTRACVLLGAFRVYARPRPKRLPMPAPSLSAMHRAESLAPPAHARRHRRCRR